MRAAYVYVCLFVYYVILSVPQGVVETRLVGNTLVVGDYEETLPKSVDVGSMCVTKRQGYLVFKFSEFSFSF